MRRVAAALITVVVFAIVLVIVSRRPVSTTGTAPASTPDGCIERMFDAAEQGDVAAYLDCFTGSERERLERELADQSADQFARSLVEAVQSLKGRAVFHRPAEQVTDGATEIVIERIYANRMERQAYRLIRQADAWRICFVQQTEPFQPEIPYGTPVFELPASED